MICALSAAALLAGCSSMGKGVNGMGRGAADTARMTRHGMGDAVTAPLKDFGLMKAKVPPVLLEAETDVYRMPARVDCPYLQYEVARLDLVLGPDVDLPRGANKQTMVGRGSRAASDAALDAVRDLTTGWIPFRSTVRRLTGAADNQDDIEDAVHAGSLRRAYLKGLGVQQGCLHPAAPLPAPGRAPMIAAQTPAAPTPASTPATVEVVRTGEAAVSAPAQATPSSSEVSATPGG